MVGSMAEYLRQGLGSTRGVAKLGWKMCVSFLPVVLLLLVGAWYDSGSESSKIPLLSSSESRRERSGGGAAYDSRRSSSVRMTSLPWERGMLMSSVLTVLFNCTPSSLKCEFQSDENELKGVE